MGSSAFLEVHLFLPFFLLPCEDTAFLPSREAESSSYHTTEPVGVLILAVSRAVRK
jgi:hypothetical protein